jgi:hypothetical protein
MSEILQHYRPRMIEARAPGFHIENLGVGKYADRLHLRIKQMRLLQSASVAELRDVKPGVANLSQSLAERLNGRLIALKAMCSKIAMHLDPEWRAGLLRKLDEMLDPEEWDHEFDLPSEKSFSTFLRMVIYLHPTRRPSIGLAHNGSFLAAWRNGDDRIVIECLANDQVRWILSHTVDGDRERGAGETQIHRVPEVTSAYDPQNLFSNGHKLLA